MTRAAVVASLFTLAFASSALAQSKLSLSPADGRFHQKHVKGLSLTCNTCHAAELKDVLFLRHDESQGIGPVDRNGCLTCHKAPARPTWYGASSRQ